MVSTDIPLKLNIFQNLTFHVRKREEKDLQGSGKMIGSAIVDNNHARSFCQDLLRFNLPNLKITRAN